MSKAPIYSPASHNHTKCASLAVFQSASEVRIVVLRTALKAHSLGTARWISATSTGPSLTRVGPLWQAMMPPPPPPRRRSLLIMAPQTSHWSIAMATVSVACVILISNNNIIYIYIYKALSFTNMF